MSSFYINGVREGKEISYYPDQRIFYQGSYYNGQKIGAWEYFTKEGVSDTIINYNE